MPKLPKISTPADTRNATIASVREAASTHSRKRGAPKVAFPTPNLVLSGEQEQRFIELIQSELRTLDRELGRSLTDTANSQIGSEWYTDNGNLASEQVTIAENSWMGKRQRFEMDFENRRAHRARKGTVFAQSNLTLSTSRRITGQRAARFRRAIFDAMPYFQIDSLPVRERDFIAQLQVVAETMANNSRSNSEFQQAVARACVLGEAVIYTRPVRDEESYAEFQKVLVDDFGTKPVLAGDWDYITADDVWQPTQEVTASDSQGMGAAPSPEEMAAPLTQGVDPSILTESLARNPATTRKGRQSGVDKDGNPIMSWEIISPAHDMQPIPANKYRAGVWPKRHTHYAGAKSSLVFWRDFLCPLGAASIEEAVCIAHFEPMDLATLAAQYAENAHPDTLTTAAEILNAAISANSGDLEHGADVDRPRRGIGELTDTTFGNIDRTRLSVAHVYIRCDPKNTGVTSDIYCLIDTQTWLPIHYNYTAAASATKRRPYNVICPNPVNGRWFGQGDMERFEHADALIDLYLNRAAVVQSNAGFITFWRPERTLQGERSPSLKLDPSIAYTPLGHYKPDEILSRVPLYEGQSPDLLHMMQLLSQSAINESGTANANDANAAGLDSQKTATGIRSITNAGDEMTSAALSNLKEGLGAAISAFVTVCFRTVSADDVFAVHDGPVARQFQINPRDIRHLQLSARVLLTSWWNEKITESRRAAIADINAQFLPLSSGTMSAVLDMWVDQLNAMGIENAKPMLEGIIADKKVQENLAAKAPARP